MNSCKKRCNYSENYENTLKYNQGELVIYDAKRWKAANSGKVIKQGPMMQDVNGVWKECIENENSCFIIRKRTLISHFP